MNDFSKQKVAFAVGLLAVLFTITPLLQPFGSVGYMVFGVRFTLLRLYYFLTIILALAVYSYAIQFVTARDLRYPSRVGDFLYAAAIVTPMLYVALFVAVRVIDRLSPFMDSQFRLRAETAVNLISLLVALWQMFLVRSGITKMTDRASTKQFFQEEAERFALAQKLLLAGQTNHAVLTVWKAVEDAARRSLLENNVRSIDAQPNVWTQLAKHGLLEPDQIEDVELLRQLHKSAGNIAEVISRDQAEAAIAAAGRIVTALAGQEANDTPGTA